MSSKKVSLIRILALAAVVTASALAAGAEEAPRTEVLSLEQMESLWGGAEKKCFKCDTANPKKCPAGQPGTGDCVCISTTVWGISIKKCTLKCPAGPGYFECVETGKKTDKCDPVKTTKKSCTGYAWDWAGPGNPPSCPLNFNCDTNTGAGSPSTSEGHHASCG